MGVRNGLPTREEVARIEEALDRSQGRTRAQLLRAEDAVKRSQARLERSKARVERARADIARKDGSIAFGSGARADGAGEEGLGEVCAVVSGSPRQVNPALHRWVPEGHVLFEVAIGWPADLTLADLENRLGTHGDLPQAADRVDHDHRPHRSRPRALAVLCAARLATSRLKP